MKKKALVLCAVVTVIVALIIILVLAGKENTIGMPQQETQVIAQGDNTTEVIPSESEVAEEDSSEKVMEESTPDKLENMAESSVEQKNQVIKGETVFSTEQGNGEELDEPRNPTKSMESDKADTIGESITTNNGVKIPILNQFNDAGLDAENVDDMQDWFGDVGDSNSPGYLKVTECAKVMNELTEAMEITGGFLPLQDSISFSFTDMYASDGDLALRRDIENGFYIIGINYDMSDSESFYPVEDGKDALTLLCSVVSSTPVELAEFLYQESFVVEECMTSEDTWVTVGDCQVQWGGYNGNESDELVYKIKGK